MKISFVLVALSVFVVPGLAVSATPGVLQLPQTGQTTCYSASGATVSCAGTGQDGDLKAGAAIPSPRFQDLGDGTMLDKLTDLIWAKQANTPGPANCTNSRTLDKSQFAPYITCLNTNSYLGKADWRMPNIIELSSLLNLEQANNVTWLKSLGFTAVADIYASSTYSRYDYSFRSTYNKAVSVSNGSILERVYQSEWGDPTPDYVWPVRNNP